MLTFVLILVFVLSVILVAYSLQTYRNPRKAWDRKHAVEVKASEPTDEALAKIQRNAVLAMIFGPILVAISGTVGYLKFEQQQRASETLQQQAPSSPFGSVRDANGAR